MILRCIKSFRTCSTNVVRKSCFKAFDKGIKHVAVGSLNVRNEFKGINMPKEEWGVKRLCPKCATRFYDLQNDPMTCPSCESEFDLASIIDGGNKAAREKVKVKDDVVDVDPVIDDTDDLLDDDDDVDVDDDLLDDDDDDTVALEEIADVAVDDDDN